MKYLAIFLVLSLLAMAFGMDVDSAKKIPSALTRGICSQSSDCMSPCSRMCQASGYALCYNGDCYCG
ncbi:unnamed protein product [Colias eurytheme]|nr:unnamed protein product [Colias eurytheme]